MMISKINTISSNTNTKGKAMKLIKLLNQLFRTNFKTSLDLYISSKSPTCAADVEKYQREYFDKKATGYFYQ